MRIVTFALLAVITLAITGCGGDNRAAAGPAPFPQEGAVHQEGGSMAPFYGEVYHKGRFYVYGTKAAFAKFQEEGNEPNPLATKMFIGAGPDRKTVVAETSKDNPGMTDRLVKQLRARYGVQ